MPGSGWGEERERRCCVFAQGSAESRVDLGQEIEQAPDVRLGLGQPDQFHSLWPSTGFGSTTARPGRRPPGLGRRATASYRRWRRRPRSRRNAASVPRPPDALSRRALPVPGTRRIAAFINQCGERSRLCPSCCKRSRVSSSSLTPIVGALIVSGLFGCDSRKLAVAGSPRKQSSAGFTLPGTGSRHPAGRRPAVTPTGRPASGCPAGLPRHAVLRRRAALGATARLSSARVPASPMCWHLALLRSAQHAKLSAHDQVDPPQGTRPLL